MEKLHKCTKLTVQQGKDGQNAGEVRKDRSCALCHVHEAEGHKHGRKTDCIDGSSAGKGLAEDGGGLTVTSETIKGSGRAVNVGAGGTQGL